MNTARRIMLLFFILALARPALASDVPPVAAAADLQFALARIAQQFQADTGSNVRLTFGSSGNFTRQIEQGAPFELFLSADERFVFSLSDKGLTRDRGQLYGSGRLVLFVPHGSPLDAAQGLEGVRDALAHQALQRFAIANPEHAPYGRAAMAALDSQGLSDLIRPRLVFGENAAQAAQFAASGASQGGIIPLSLVRAEQIARLGAAWLIPAEWHAAEPLHQRMVLTSKAGKTAAAFYHYLQEPPAQAILREYGFEVPGHAEQTAGVAERK